MRRRLDAELVRRGLVVSRSRAAEAIRAGRVLVGGAPASTPARQVATNEAITVNEPPPRFVSRGGEKLAAALDRFRIDVTGRRALDAGASTGGFTDCLLHRGAREVVAVDVGYGQLAWRLRTDQRVQVHDRTNVRSLTAEAIGGPVDVVVADLSFISLRLVLPALLACTAPGGELLPMVKPQFEVGRARLGSGGVVRDPALRAEAILDVARAAAELSLGLRDVVASPLPGPSGNVEYFLWLSRGPAEVGEDVVRAAVEEGTQ